MHDGLCVLQLFGICISAVEEEGEVESGVRRVKQLSVLPQVNLLGRMMRA